MLMGKLYDCSIAVLIDVGADSGMFQFARHSRTTTENVCLIVIFIIELTFSAMS